MYTGKSGCMVLNRTGDTMMAIRFTVQYEDVRTSDDEPYLASLRVVVGIEIDALISQPTDYSGVSSC